MAVRSASSLYQEARGQFFIRTGKNIEKTNIISGILLSVAFLFNSLYEYVFKRTKARLIFQDATRDELIEVGGVIGLLPLQPTKSFGLVNITGTIGTIIPQFTLFDSSTNTYTTSSSREIVQNNIILLTVSRSGILATVTSNSILNLSSGMSVDISGFSETNFNQAGVQITVISDYEFFYQVANTGNLSDSNGVLTFNGCQVQVYSEASGLLTEIQNGNILTSSIDGIDGVFVEFNGITGGTDEEDTESYRTRLQDRNRNNRNDDTSSKITTTIKNKFPSITNAKIISNYQIEIAVQSIVKDNTQSGFVRKITTYQNHGFKSGDIFTEIIGSVHDQLNIKLSERNTYITKIDDLNFYIYAYQDIYEDSSSSNMKIIPFVNFTTTLALYQRNSVNKELSTDEITAVRSYLETDVLSAFGSYYNIVSAITQNQVLQISNLNPNISTLKTAISNNIKTNISDKLKIGDRIYKSEIETIIKNTVDVNNNQVSILPTLNITTDILPTSSIHFINLNVQFN